MRLAATLLLAAALAGSARADDVVSEKPDTVKVALYHQGYVDTQQLMRGEQSAYAFGFVNETRTIALPAGPSLIRFRGVASTMVPETAHLEGLPAGAAERNFDYDLLSPGSLLAHSVGRVVHVVRTDPKTGKESTSEATVRAASGGPVIESARGIEALHCGGPPERLVFDDIPEGLADKPTFSVRVTMPEAGQYALTLSYVAMRMNWSADYVARIDPGGDTLTLSGWITLANFSDIGFADAPTQVIAGSASTTGEDRAPSARGLRIAPQCWPLAVDWAHWPPFPPPPPPAAMDNLVETVIVTASRIPQVGFYSSSPVTAVSMQEFADYKLYSLNWPTTVAANQTKQVRFLDQPAVKFERFYTYRGYPNPAGDDKDAREPATIRYRMENLEKDGLGKPLPAGSMSVVDTDPRGAPIFVGQDRIGDTPEGLPIALETGKAMDVGVQSRLVATRNAEEGGRPSRINSFEVTVRNDRSVPIRFELTQPGDVRVLEEDRRHSLDHGLFAWRFDVPAGSETVMRYSIEFWRSDY
ncbi:MAG TPA: hypothetical protein VG889_02715 [Rhizomicrobium sp.]|nr:hypothetical protein [Rhizomicrobium sp.]